MEKKRIYLQGLNYRRSDREAIPGDCRTLQNLYPTGDIDKPSWKAVKEAIDFYDRSANEWDQWNKHYVFAHYVWYRANQPTLLILGLSHIETNPSILAPNNVTKSQILVSLEVDSSGALVNVLNHTQIYYFPVYHPNKRLEFTQVGDALIISEIDLEEPKDLFMLITDGTEVIRQPFNLPSAPTISCERIDKASGEPGLPLGWYGYRWGLILMDGTIARTSPIRAKKVEADSTYDFEFNMSPVQIPMGGTNWNKIIRGVGLFVSEKIINPIDTTLDPLPDATAPDSPEKVFSEGIFHLVHVFEEVFNKEDSFTVNNYELQILTADLMQEDSLLVHRVLARTLGSYNKCLLLGGVKYDFVRPASMDFIPADSITRVDSLPVTINDPSSSLTPESSYLFNTGVGWLNFFDVVLAWDNPANLLSVSLERLIKLEQWFDGEAIRVTYNNGQGNAPVKLLTKDETKRRQYMEKFQVLVPADWLSYIYGDHGQYRKLVVRYTITAHYKNGDSVEAYTDLIYPEPE